MVLDTQVGAESLAKMCSHGGALCSACRLQISDARGDAPDGLREQNVDVDEVLRGSSGKDGLSVKQHGHATANTI